MQEAASSCVGLWLASLLMSTACSTHETLAVAPPTTAIPGASERASIAARGSAPAFERTTAAEARVDPIELGKVEREAEQTHSDAVVILKDGKVLLERAFTSGGSQPIELMSVTKSIAALAIGLLIDDHAIASLDVPVHRWFPEWKQGRKERITLRHVLSHTSGIEAKDDTSDIWGHPDFVQLALTADVVSEPGSTFHYNNKAVMLLAGIVARAARMPLDAFLKQRLFEPLGITTFEWLKDDAGNPTVMSGLKMRAVDLARIGEMMRMGGLGATRTPTNAPLRILSENEVRWTTTPSTREFPQVGRLWWSVMEEPIKVRVFAHRTNERQQIGYAARGYLGQELLVLSERGVVAVRLRSWSKDARTGPDDFPDFEARIRALFGA